MTLMEYMQEINVLLLAAGRSRRAQPIEDKALIEFAGKTLIEHRLDQIQRLGLGNIHIAVGAHNAEKIAALAEKYDARIVLQENLEDGMAGAVLETLNLIEEKNGDDGQALLIINSNDIVEDFAISKILEMSADISLLAYRVKTYFPGGYLKLDGNRVTQIIEKPEKGSEPSDLVNIVVHLHKDTKALKKAIESTQTQKDDMYEEALLKLMSTHRVEAFEYSGSWQTIKYPWHVLDIMNDFMPKENFIHPESEIAETAIIKGPVHISKGVKILDYAVIQGPAFLGENCLVGNQALIRHSMLGANCIVGYASEIARSHIGSNCRFHTNYVGDTVMGENCSFGSGAVFANLRLDEGEIKSSGQASGRNKLGGILGSRIRVGVNTSIMPGLRIGSGTFIGSGMTISKDIPAGRFISMKDGVLEDRENTA